MDFTTLTLYWLAIAPTWFIVVLLASIVFLGVRGLFREMYREE